MKSRYSVDGIVVIGGDAGASVVKWAEYNGSHGLYTGFKVIEVVSDNSVKINGFTDIIEEENIAYYFEEDSDFLEWIKEELEDNRSKEEMEIFENDFTDFIVK